jgi:predicted nucleotide-binding protein
MDRNEARAILEQGGLQIANEKRLGNESGWQLRLKSGQVVNIYDKGTVYVQGRGADPIQRLLESAPDGQGQGLATRNVFVVYGHDQTARTQLDAMLRRWDLNPLFLDELPSEGQTIIEKLERFRNQAAFAVVLATPDDEGYRAGRSDEVALRARQNVVLELGMVLASLGRARVAILLKNQEKMERPSDIQGLIYVPFKDDVREAALLLAKEMNAQGLRINLDRL